MINSAVIINQYRNTVEAISQFPILPQYRNFTFTATADGQTDFELSDYPVLTGIIVVNINGVAQDPLNGDYTIDGNILTLSPGVDEGDRVFGFYQVLMPAVSPNPLDFASYFEQVTLQDKAIFTLDFQPNPIVYVAVNGVIQDNEDYTISGYTLTLNSGLDIDDKLYVVGIQS